MNIFDILINYLQANIDSNSHCYEALHYALQFVAYYQKLTAFQLSIISTFIRKFDSPELYEKLVSKIGNIETQLIGKEGFLIQHPIFLPIFAFSYGFTNRVIKLFNELIDFSLLNTSYFHKYKIDQIILSYLLNSFDTKFQYAEVEFEIEKGDKSKMKNLLHKIMGVNSDFSIISLFLNNLEILPELQYLLEKSLNDPRPVVPFGFFKSNYYCQKINSNCFQKPFTLTFWILIDTFVEVKKTDINLITFTCNNAILKIFIQKLQIKVSLETNKNITEVILRQSISYQMKWKLFTLIFDPETLLISTFIDDGDMCQSKFVPIAFQSNSQVKLSVGGSTNQQFHHKICGYVGTISLYNRILSHEEIVHLFNIKTVAATFDPSSVIASSANANDFTYIKNSYTNETVLSTLCNPSTINKIFHLLAQEQTEEGCYKYLSLIDSLSYVLPIEVLPIYNFISQESHFNYKKLYKIVFSIFSHISQRYKNDDDNNNTNNNTNNNSNNNDSISSSGSSSLISNLNLNLIRYRNIRQDLNLQQKWFRYIIVNLDIWINYSNFDEILYIWNSKLISKYQFLFNESPYISTFLAKIEKLEEKNLSRNHWNLFFIFLERLSFINLSSEEERVIFSIISELIAKFQKLMTTEAYMKGTLQFCTFSHEIKRMIRVNSNLDDSCFQVFNDGNENDSINDSTGKKKRFKLKEKIKKRFNRRKRKKNHLDSFPKQISVSMSVDQVISSIHKSYLKEEDESESSNSFSKLVDINDDRNGIKVKTDDNDFTDDDDDESSENTTNTYSNSNKYNNTNNNENDEQENDCENNDENNNDDDDDDDENNNNDDDDNENNNNNDDDDDNENNNNDDDDNDENDNNDDDGNENNNNNDNENNNNDDDDDDDNDDNNDNNIIDNDNDDNNIIDNESNKKKKKKGRRLSKLFKNKLFSKPRRKRKSLEYDHKAFGLVGFSSKGEMEKASNKLVYLLQFTHFTSWAKNSKNSTNNTNNNIDDDNEEVNNESTILSINTSAKDLVRQIYNALQKESKQFYVIFSALRIKDEKIASVALFGIHEIIPHSSVLKYTTEALRVLDPQVYNGIIENLMAQIHMYPYLFPIFCALIIFNSNYTYDTNNKNKSHHCKNKMCEIFHNDKFISNLSKVYIGDNHEKWIFFPLFLAFFVEDRIAKEEILSVVVRSVSGNWDAILSVISLMTYIQEYFPASEEDDTLLIFYMLLTNYNYQDNKNIGDIFVQVCYSLFFVIIPTKIKETTFSFNNIDDVINFINQSNSSFNVKFFIRLENESVFCRGLKDLAFSQINESINHCRFYNQEYIRNIVIVFNSILHFTEIKSCDYYNSICKFIEKMRLDYKEQYSKHIHSVLEKVKKSLNSKAFQYFTSEKFIVSISHSKSSTTFNIDDIADKGYQSMISNKTSSSNKDENDNFYQLGLKLKNSVDSNFRQSILEPISTTNPERKNELKEININCHVYKKEGDEAIPASFEMKKGVISIKTEFKSFKIDRRDVCGFKRENQAIEFLTNEGKVFFVVFNETEANKILRAKMTKKKTASRPFVAKLLQKNVEKWKDYKLTTFQLLMLINFFYGRTQKSSLRACFPSMLSRDVHKNNNQLLEFSDDLNVDDMSFETDFAQEKEIESNKMISEVKSKNVISAELYYLFESISKSESIPSKFAKDRFEFIYKIRKMIEKVENIELWIEKVFHITIPHRLKCQPIQINEKEKLLFDPKSKVQIKFAAIIDDNNIRNKCDDDELNYIYKYIICSTEGQLFIVTDKEISELTDQSVDISHESKFFSLTDGVAIYNNKLHNLTTVDQEGKVKTINNVYIDPNIASFTGSVKRIAYLSTPTRINLVRDLTFKGYLVTKKSTERKNFLAPSKKQSTAVKLDTEGNQQIHQLPSCVKILRTSLNFNIIVAYSEDTCVRILSLYDSKYINEFNLNGKEAIEIIITNLFGFILIFTKLKAYLVTNNGTLIKKVKFDFSLVSSWFTFTSRDGIDFIGMVMKDDNKVVVFEAFYLDRINEISSSFDGIPHSLAITFDPISEHFFAIDVNGKITAIACPSFE